MEDGEEEGDEDVLAERKVDPLTPLAAVILFDELRLGLVSGAILVPVESLKSAHIAALLLAFLWPSTSVGQM